MSLGSLLLSAAVNGRGNKPSSLLFADGRPEPLDRGRVHLRVFALLVCVRRFYFSSSSRHSAVMLYLHGRARGLSQVEIPPRETTTLCLCWFHQTYYSVCTSCSASDVPHFFLGEVQRDDIKCASCLFCRFHVSGVSRTFHLSGGSGGSPGEGTTSNVTN